MSGELKMSFITIKYEIDKNENVIYEKVCLTNEKDKEFEFKSGNFTRDWYDATKFIQTNDDFSYLNSSSSVNHFIWDSKDQYKPIYVYYNNGWEITENVRYFMDEVMDSYHYFELFLNKDESYSSWSELKERYDNI